LRAPVHTHVAHPNLSLFSFVGVGAYLEAILPHMTTPFLETFSVEFFNQPSFSVPCLPQFMMTTGNLRFTRATFLFHHQAVVMFLYPHLDDEFNNVDIKVCSGYLDWQVSSMAQISVVLSPLFPTVVDLTLDYREHGLSSAWHNQADRTRWRELLGSFRNVKTLRVHSGLVGEISRSLQSDGEPPLEVLPGLKEIVCPAGSVDDKTFAPLQGSLLASSGRSCRSHSL
jgi:hypothetical protein